MKNPKILQTYFGSSSAYFAVLCHLFSVQEDQRTAAEQAVTKALMAFDPQAAALDVKRLVSDAIAHGVASGYLDRLRGDRLRLTPDGAAAVTAVAGLHQTILDHTSLRADC